LYCDEGSRPTVCVTCVWAGVDSAWEQEKLEARKIFEKAARREAAVPSVQSTLGWAFGCKHSC